MREQIEAKIADWQAELEQLNARRQQLATMASDCDVSIQRHIGAITGARELLAALQPEAPAPEEGAE